MKIFKDFFDCKIVLAANHHYPENIQRLFCLQKCFRRKSSLSWKYSKTFSPAKLSSTQITIILKIFKDFFACKIVLAANDHYLEKIQKLLWLQNCLSRKSLSWKHSKTFSPAKLSSMQIIIILKTFKDFFACNIVLDANHHYPGIIQWLFLLQIVLAANHLYLENIQRLFWLQNCLRRKSSLSWKYLKTFDCKIVLAANHHYPENIQRLFCLQKCFRRKSSLSWKYSKTFSPAKLSSTQITIILKIFKDFFACNFVSDANHHYPGNIQRFFQWQICLRRKSSLSIILKIFKDFFACKILSDANHHYPANIQRLFRL